MAPTASKSFVIRGVAALAGGLAACCAWRTLPITDVIVPRHNWWHLLLLRRCSTMGQRGAAAALPTLLRLSLLCCRGLVCSSCGAAVWAGDVVKVQVAIIRPILLYSSIPVRPLSLIRFLLLLLLLFFFLLLLILLQAIVSLSCCIAATRAVAVLTAAQVVLLTASSSTRAVMVAVESRVDSSWCCAVDLS